MLMAMRRASSAVSTFACRGVILLSWWHHHSPPAPAGRALFGLVSAFLLIHGTNKVRVREFWECLQFLPRFLESQYPLYVFWYNVLSQLIFVERVKLRGSLIEPAGPLCICFHAE
jgi:hypothetical protein